MPGVEVGVSGVEVGVPGVEVGVSGVRWVYLGCGRCAWGGEGRVCGVGVSVLGVEVGVGVEWVWVCLGLRQGWMWVWSGCAWGGDGYGCEVVVGHGWERAMHGRRSIIAVLTYKNKTTHNSITLL